VTGCKDDFAPWFHRLKLMSTKFCLLLKTSCRPTGNINEALDSVLPFLQATDSDFWQAKIEPLKHSLAQRHPSHYLRDAAEDRHVKCQARHTRSGLQR